MHPITFEEILVTSTFFQKLKVDYHIFITVSFFPDNSLVCDSSDAENWQIEESQKETKPDEHDRRSTSLTMCSTYNAVNCKGEQKKTQCKQQHKKKKE